jgi:hypothetical protein
MSAPPGGYAATCGSDTRDHTDALPDAERVHLER